MNFGIPVVFMNEYKSCEISYQMFLNVMFSFSKTKDKLVMMQILHHKKIKLFSGAISHGLSNEPEAYLEPSQASMYKGAFLQK